MGNTERMTVDFEAKEMGEKYVPYIMISSGKSLSILPEKDELFFDLKVGTTMDEARSIAKYLNNHIVSIGHVHP